MKDSLSLWSGPKLISRLKPCCVALLLLFAGCDGSFTGGGIGGTGAPTAPALVVGVVDGFGSIVINDERYVTDNAKLFTDGSPVTLSDLRIGMSISAEVDTHSMHATELRYQPDFVGPVASVDSDNRTLVIHGQTATWNERTVFDALDVSELTAGLELEVSGARDANQEIVATFIRKAIVGQSYFAVGRVEPGGVETEFVGKEAVGKEAVDKEAVDKDPLQGTENGAVRMTGAVIDFRRAAESLGISPSEFRSTYLEFGSIVRVGVNGRVGDTTQANTTSDDSNIVTLAITGAQPVTRPSYDTGIPVQVLGIVSTTERDNVFLIGDLEVLVDAGGVTETRSALGMTIEFPALPENRPVLADGMAQAANGEILINLIQFLDHE